ncbi:6553_t:CDS:2 [Paraglomus occultum]|uniref:6553_t:CDS:1 n=1 Tax=Paraglomus occultum TaxID=144539 RepID=A0A9N8YV41_9GLOM|nr:6553_t:CDS:2 [Paraglomus occultum]
MVNTNDMINDTADNAANRDAPLYDSDDDRSDEFSDMEESAFNINESETHTSSDSVSSFTASSDSSTASDTPPTANSSPSIDDPNCPLQFFGPDHHEIWDTEWQPISY